MIAVLIYSLFVDVRVGGRVLGEDKLLINDNRTPAVSLSSRIAVIIADALVLLVTWSKTLQIYMEARRCKTNLPVATLLVRDGESIMVSILRY